MKAPIGYSLIPNNAQLAVIDDTIANVADGKASLREAAAQLKDKLGHSVSHEWVRTKAKAIKEKQQKKEDNND